ncbi:MAG TPA: DUF502 domain-containing protein, partial [Fontimonas sp.]
MNSKTSRLRQYVGRFARIFLTGLLALLPILVTVAIVMWLIRLAESIFGKLFDALLPSSLYLPGMGLALAVLVIFLIGLGLQGVLMNQVLAAFESILNRIPLVKTVYGAVRDLTGMLGNKSTRRF